jgi:hypothetical protein
MNHIHLDHTISAKDQGLVVVISQSRSGNAPLAPAGARLDASVALAISLMILSACSYADRTLIIATERRLPVQQAREWTLSQHDICPGESMTVRYPRRLQAHARVLSASGTVLATFPAGQTVQWTTPPLYPAMSPLRLEAMSRDGLVSQSSWRPIMNFRVPFLDGDETVRIRTTSLVGGVSLGFAETLEGEPNSQWGRWECEESHQERVCTGSHVECSNDREWCNSGREDEQEGGGSRGVTFCCRTVEDCQWEDVCDSEQWIPEAFDRHPVYYDIERVTWSGAGMFSEGVRLTSVTNRTETLMPAIVSRSSSDGGAPQHVATLMRGETKPVLIGGSALRAVQWPNDSVQCGHVDVPQGQLPTVSQVQASCARIGGMFTLLAVASCGARSNPTRVRSSMDR